jgi:ankyrin repeat protein
VFGAGASEVADAAMRGNHAAIHRLVAQHAGVNPPKADGATTLHWAVFHSDRDTVDLLLKAAANRDGSTPLWLASINVDAGILVSLLNGGADTNETLPLGRTPLMAAARTWFARLEREVIARDIFASVDDLARKLRYVRDYSKTARTFKWTYNDLRRRIQPS